MPSFFPEISRISTSPAITPPAAQIDPHSDVTDQKGYAAGLQFHFRSLSKNEKRVAITLLVLAIVAIVVGAIYLHSSSSSLAEKASLANMGAGTGVAGMTTGETCTWAVATLAAGAGVAGITLIIVIINYLHLKKKVDDHLKNKTVENFNFDDTILPINDSHGRIQFSTFEGTTKYRHIYCYRSEQIKDENVG